MQELVAEEGIAPEVAAAQADDEIEGLLVYTESQIDQEFKEKERVEKAALETKLDTDTSLLKDRYFQSLSILENGLEAHKAAERRKLEKALEAKRAQRKKDLMSQGLSAAVAEDAAQQEVAVEATQLTTQVEARVELAKKSVAECLER